MIEIEEIYCFKCQNKMEQSSEFLFTDGQYVGYHFSCFNCDIQVYTKRPLVKQK